MSTAQPRVGEAAREVARVMRWLADADFGEVGDGELLDLVETLAPVTDRLAHVQVEALSAAQDAIPEREGLLPDAWLQIAARRSGADRRTLLIAAEVLPSLPRVRAAARSGAMSWSEVRVICLRAAPLSVEQRTYVDVALAGDGDELTLRGADETIELLDQVIDELRPADLERRETREFASQFVGFNPRLDGTGTFYGDLDAPTFTDVTNRITEFADTIPATADPDTDADMPAWRSRGLRQALALHALITRNGDDRQPSAKLLVTIDGTGLDPEALRRIVDGCGLDDVDLAEAVTDTAGRGLRATLHHRRGRRPISQAQLRRLLGGAQLRALLTGDGVPLKAGRTTRFATTAQRDAAAALYGGCAWPRCPAPMVACEMHHVVPWHPPHHGRTDDDNLVPLCGVHHHAITHGRWTLKLHRDRSVEVARGRRRHRSIPRARQRARSLDGRPADTRPPGRDPPRTGQSDKTRASPADTAERDPPADQQAEPTLPF